MNVGPADDLDEKIAPHLEYFADRANLLFAYHFCVLEFHDDEDFQTKAFESDRAWMLATVQTACMHASLIALRDLEDFFSARTKNSNPSDLRSSDFGMDVPLRILTADQRNWINKLIVHTTREGAAMVGHRWSILDLISNAVKQCAIFLEWIKRNYGVENPNTCIVAGTMQAGTQAIFKSIFEISQRQRTEAHNKTPNDNLLRHIFTFNVFPVDPRDPHSTPLEVARTYSSFRQELSHTQSQGTITCQISSSS